jgi:hypothetical protein
LADVSCASASECIAVGSKGGSSLAQRWNGSEWSTMTSPGEGSSLTDVSCGSTSFCLAIPGGGLKTQRWNGSEWAITTGLTPPEAASTNFTGVACTPSNICILVGYYTLASGKTRTLAERKNGAEWTILTTPSEEGVFNYLNAVSCTSSTSCTAIGKQGGVPMALRWNGTEWSALAAPQEASNVSADLSCATDNACTAVLGNSAKVERWNGSEWTNATVPTPEGGSAITLKGVSCATSTSCTAVGSYTKESKTVTLAEGWNGSTWSVQSTPNYPEGGGGVFAGVSCFFSMKCTAVGYYTPATGEAKTLAARYE